MQDEAKVDQTVVPFKAPYNPRDLSVMRVDQSFAGGAVKQLLTDITVRKPKGDEWVRVHAEYRVNTWIHKPSSKPNELYYVVPSVVDALPPESVRRSITPSVLALCSCRRRSCVRGGGRSNCAAASPRSWRGQAIGVEALNTSSTQTWPRPLATGMRSSTYSQTLTSGAACTASRASTLGARTTSAVCSISPRARRLVWADCGG